MTATANARPLPLLTDRAYERIRHDIITCAIAPGTEVSEPQLCTHFRLGKAPVRMALNRLAHDGLVRAMPDRKSTRLNSSHVSESRMPSSA